MNPETAQLRAPASALMIGFMVAALVLQFWFPALQGVAMVFGVVAVPLLTAALIESIAWRREKERAGMPEREPTLLGGYVRALHDRVCPQITFR